VRYRQSWKDLIAATMSGATSAIRQRYRSRHPDAKAVDEPRSGFRRTTTERVARRAPDSSLGEILGGNEHD
jgi:hypothetical protein